MKKIAVFFSNGTEEIEALSPVDVLRRAGAQCDIVSMSGEFPVGSHGITVKADKIIQDFNFSEYDAFIIPGGMPGATNIANDKKVIDCLRWAFDSGKIVAGICAAPAVVFGAKGLVKDKKVTCYPADQFIEMLKDLIYTGQDVEIDGNLITANGPKSALKFSLAICKSLDIEPKF